MQHSSPRILPVLKGPFLPLLAALVLVGGWLRLWGWSGQVLLDDEWHALNFVLGKSLGQVFFSQGLGANSIPVNIYDWLLLHTLGWSEPLLRLPSLAAGIASLIVLPLLAARLWGRGVALVGGALMSAAPLLVFYSRVARPYAPAMLLACSSLLLTLLWLRERRSRDVLLSALCGALAVYYHLYMAIPVGLPLAVAAVHTLRRGRGDRIVPGEQRALLLAAGLFLLVVIPLVVVPNLLNPWWAHGIHGISRATPATAARVLELASGSHQPLLQFLLLGLFLSGLVLVWRESPVQGLALSAPFAAFTAAMSLTTQDGAHAGIQVCRYGIALFPLAYLVVALSAVRLMGRMQAGLQSPLRRMAGGVIGGAVLCIWLATSPLWRTYSAPNNFTNHSAFQDHYAPDDWSRSPQRDLIRGYSISRRQVSPLYLSVERLARLPGIIEYPLVVGDHLNIAYYYQQLHRRPVVAGFIEVADPAAPPGSDYVMADYPFDLILANLAASSDRRQRWYSMVNLEDTKRLQEEYRGWLLVVHRDVLAEITGREHPQDPGIEQVTSLALQRFGSPVYLDDTLAAWIVK